MVFFSHLTQQWARMWGDGVLGRLLQVGISGLKLFPSCSLPFAVVCLFRKRLGKKGNIHTWERCKNIPSFLSTNFTLVRTPVFPPNYKREWEIYYCCVPSSRMETLGELPACPCCRLYFWLPITHFIIFPT